MIAAPFIRAFFHKLYFIELIFYLLRTRGIESRWRGNIVRSCTDSWTRLRTSLPSYLLRVYSISIPICFRCFHYLYRFRWFFIPPAGKTGVTRINRKYSLDDTLNVLSPSGRVTTPRTNARGWTSAINEGITEIPPAKCVTCGSRVVHDTNTCSEHATFQLI